MCSAFNLLVTLRLRKQAYINNSFIDNLFLMKHVVQTHANWYQRKHSYTGFLKKNLEAYTGRRISCLPKFLWIEEEWKTTFQNQAQN